MTLQSFEFFSLGVYFKVQILYAKLYRNVRYVLGFTIILDVSSGDMIWKIHITQQGLQQKQNLKIRHDVGKWSNIPQKSCSVHTAIFLKHVQPFSTLCVKGLRYGKIPDIYHTTVYAKIHTPHGIRCNPENINMRTA